MQHDVIFSQAFSKRLEAARLLRAATSSPHWSPEPLRNAADALDGHAALFDSVSIAGSYSAFADLVRIATMLVEWRATILNAGPESERFRVSAKERCKLFRSEYANRPLIPAFFDAIAAVEDAANVNHVEWVCAKVASIPLPIPFFAALIRQSWAGKKPSDDAEPKPQPSELSVAFVRFEINGVLANQTHFLPPQMAHDLELEVRVSRWPESASHMSLSPVSIEAASSYDFPSFRFSKPEGPPPYILKQRGRAILQLPQSIYARPFEFRYTAEFVPTSSEQPIAVVGQRTLRIESIDTERSPLSGYPRMDHKILEVRNLLRAQNLIFEAELRSGVLLLAALGNLSCQGLHGNSFPSQISEAEFQREVKRVLRGRPDIGAELEEAPKASGGITDLSFRGIPIELKVSDRNMSLQGCDKFVDQAVSYAVGRGKRIAFLCVLDCSNKTSPPIPAESLIDVAQRHSGNAAVSVVVIIVQGNLARPSSFSR